MDLKERNALGEQADRHWYYTSKANMITRHFASPAGEVLDVGAGLGWFSDWLLRNGHAESAVCVDPGYDQPIRNETVAGRPIRYVQEIGETEADLVLLMDVLEHVDDDVALLREYWEKARPGTTFVITVPAFEFLWSAHDDFLEHRRRYTTAMLAETIRAAGASPDRLHYYFGAVFPVAVAVRLARRRSDADSSDMKPVPEALNSVLKAICRAETHLMKLNRLGGLSVVASFRKPDA